ncbi:MAG: adaptor protein MecA [Defluviitaleaceae bacterium]|nr:adaptor protein MecA [Defluviitaleaceae bacterium]
MKIEKISDNQIRFILNRNDLTDRGINFSELEYGSEKARDLFNDMMEQANIECGFTVDNALLMIEAIPITTDSIMVIVTKITNLNLKDFESRFNLFSGEYQDSVLQETFTKDSQKETANKGDLVIYYFNNLDEIIDISKKIVDFFEGYSSVYKYNKQYYLILDGNGIAKISNIVSEYVNSYSVDAKSKYYIMEHGEVITKEHALEKFSTM